MRNLFHPPRVPPAPPRFGLRFGLTRAGAARVGKRWPLGWTESFGGNNPRRLCAQTLAAGGSWRRRNANWKTLSTRVYRRSWREQPLEVVRVNVGRRSRQARVQAQARRELANAGRWSRLAKAQRKLENVVHPGGQEASAETTARGCARKRWPPGAAGAGVAQAGKRCPPGWTPGTDSTGSTSNSKSTHCKSPRGGSRQRAAHTNPWSPVNVGRWDELVAPRGRS